MKSQAVIVAALGVLAAVPGYAQTYSAYGQVASRPQGGGGSSVAFDQPLYYVPRIQAVKNYPPNLYGYIETGPGLAYKQGSALKQGR